LAVLSEAYEKANAHSFSGASTPRVILLGPVQVRPE